MVDGFIAQASDAVGGAGGGWLLPVIVAVVLIALVAALGSVMEFARFSFKRAWAISSVTFRESVRRRVLWITPLAMIGVIAVTQLSRPIDPQDAIRTATKYTLFASGIVVVIATLILACTSLPREIENRVIYTIVTKPTTRLEIVVGKTLGFARTSALILLIMGLFAYAYLRVSAAQLTAVITEQLALPTAPEVGRQTLEHYKAQGLLQARTFATPADLQVYAAVPRPGDPVTWTFGKEEQLVMYAFDVPDRVVDDRDGLDTQINVEVKVAVKQRPLGTTEQAEVADAGNAAAADGTAARMPGPASIEMSILTEKWFTAVQPTQLIDARNTDPFKLNANEAGPTGKSARLRPPVGQPERPMEPDKVVRLEALLVIPRPVILERLRPIPEGAGGKRRIVVSISGTSAGTQYGFAPDSVTARVVQKTFEIDPVSKRRVNERDMPPLTLKQAEVASPSGTPATVLFRSRTSSTGGQQLRGDTNPAEAPVGIYRFRGADLSGGGDSVPFEFRAKIERSGADATEAENASVVQFTFVDATTGAESTPVTVVPESDRPAFFTVPRAALGSGDFDVHVRSRTAGHVVGLRGGKVASLAAVTRVNSFAFNLAKSLLVLWLLSILVVSISIFCSTLVSWPIAVVMTLVILLGRWCVTQVGQPATPDQMATDLLGQNASATGKQLFAGTVTGLNAGLKAIAHVLPETERFRVTEDIDRGVNIPARTLFEALGVLGGYAVPVLLLGYLRLRHKEVAP
ncbi:MAG TPA: ABC transporter permease [Tepidisphaeraceae bacterium]|nr:ABC transporter permease [Tepidisphaeraceae bacterium]